MVIFYFGNVGLHVCVPFLFCFVYSLVSYSSFGILPLGIQGMDEESVCRLDDRSTGRGNGGYNVGGNEE